MGEVLPLHEQPHEDILRDVVGVVLVAHQPVADPPHPLLVPSHELYEGRAVGSLASSFGG